MPNLVLIFGLLLAYTFIYTGVSYFWQGVTVAYTPGNNSAGG